MSHWSPMKQETKLKKYSVLRALWRYNALSVTIHIADFALLIL